MYIHKVIVWEKIAKKTIVPIPDGSAVKENMDKGFIWQGVSTR
jgi:hypothetical protein